MLCLWVQVTVNGTAYHKSCFKCSHGGCTISPSNYIAHEGKLYCKHHHIQLFKEKGNYSQLETERQKNNSAVAAAIKLTTPMEIAAESQQYMILYQSLTSFNSSHLQKNQILLNIVCCKICVVCFLHFFKSGLLLLLLSFSVEGQFVDDVFTIFSCKRFNKLFILFNVIQSFLIFFYILLYIFFYLLTSSV